MNTSNNIILEIQNINMQFGGLKAINNVSFFVRENEIKGIIGPNGAGKTTLFNVITGELKPTSGKIFLYGENLKGLPPHLICKKGLSRTFQLTLVFPEMTVFESIWIGINSCERFPWNPVTLADKIENILRKAEETCKLVGLWEKRNELASNLSYGDQKILEIAMALSIQPKVILLDEPTQGVDPKETASVIEVVKKLSKKMTIILIEHNMDVVLQLCNSILVLNEGSIIAEGNPQEISQNEEVQKVYLGDIS